MCSGGCGPSSCNCRAVVVSTGPKGDTGASAYQAWLALGNSGTEADFINSLQGAQGVQGDPGATGATGAAGAAGADGVDGENAFTTLTIGFNQPAVGANVFVQDTTGGFGFIGLGQIIQMETGGFYRAASVPSAGNTIVNLTNLGYAADAFGFPGNAAPGAAIATGVKVSPGGVRGPAGATGATGPVGPAGAAGAAGAAGTDGSTTTFGTELPNTLAPGVGNVGDYRIRVSAGTPAVLLDMWVKIDNTPTWNLVGSFPNAGGSDDQTFTAVKTSTQPIPFTNTDTLVTVENDSVSPGRDPSGVWNGSVCTFTAAATAIQVVARDFSMRRSSGTQVVTFTAHIYHRPFSTGIDVSIGSATFVYTGAAETTITNPLIVSSTTNFAIGDQLRLVIDPSVAPTDTFNVVITPAALRFYTQAI